MGYSLFAAWLALGIACTHDRTAADAADPIACETAFQAALDRACNVPADCTLAEHSDCCGITMVGVRAGTQAATADAERTYLACYRCPPVGCAHATRAEDGAVPSMAGQAIVSTCVQSQCTSIVQ